MNKTTNVPCSGHGHTCPLDLTKNTLGGGRLYHRAARAVRPVLVPVHGATSGYGGFGSDNGVTFTTQTTSGTNTGITAGTLGAAVVHQSGQMTVNDAQQGNNCNIGQEFLPVQDIKARPLDYSRTKKGPLTFGRKGLSGTIHKNSQDMKQPLLNQETSLQTCSETWGCSRNCKRR